MNKQPTITINDAICTIHTPNRNYYCVPDMVVPTVKRLGLEWTPPTIQVGKYVIHHAIPEMGRIMQIKRGYATIRFGVGARGQCEQVKIKVVDITYPDFTSDRLAWKGCNYEQI